MIKSKKYDLFDLDLNICWTNNFKIPSSTKIVQYSLFKIIPGL